MNSPADFAAAIDRWCEQAEALPDQVFRGIAEAALQRVKELTPVDTGNLRANWSITLGDEQPIIGRDDRNPDGAPLRVDLSWLKAGEVIRIVNPVAYARPVEYGYTIKLKDGGTRQVEGRHMAQQTILELPRIAEDVVRQLGGGPR
jgi:hypothetical protein